MPREIKGDLAAKGKKFAIVAGRFNEFITTSLVSGAVDVLKRHGCSDDDITVVQVPGAFDIPLVAKKLAESATYDAVVCVGCVIRGQTPHFEYVAGEAAKGIAHVAMETGVPATFGVITSDTLEQAIERAGSKGGNKGADAASAAIELVDVLAKVAGSARS